MLESNRQRCESHGHSSFPGIVDIQLIKKVFIIILALTHHFDGTFICDVAEFNELSQHQLNQRIGFRTFFQFAVIGVIIFYECFVDIVLDQ